MKVRLTCEFRYPPASKGVAPKLAFRWTTPEVDGLDAAKRAAKDRAEKAGYTVRSANFLAAKSAEPAGLIIYVTKGN